MIPFAYSQNWPESIGTLQGLLTNASNIDEYGNPIPGALVSRVHEARFQIGEIWQQLTDPGGEYSDDERDEMKIEIMNICLARKDDFAKVETQRAHLLYQMLAVLGVPSDNTAAFPVD